MSVPHALFCLKMSYIPVEVRDTNDVLVSSGWTEGYEGRSIYVMNPDTSECQKYPMSWVKLIVS